jgi:hypothetical protein
MRTHGRTHRRTHGLAPQIHRRLFASLRVSNRLVGVCDDGLFDELYGRIPRTPRDELLTLAVLEDGAAVLDRHGFPPLRGYALAELTASLYPAPAAPQLTGGGAAHKLPGAQRRMPIPGCAEMILAIERKVRARR